MPHVVKGARILMGTFVTIMALHPDQDQGQNALLAAFDEIRRISGLMSVHAQNSEVSRLNKSGLCEGVSEDTRNVIERAQYFSRLSDGAFDITILPLLKLWEVSAGQGTSPTDAQIADTIELVDYKNVIVADSRVAFRRSGMCITAAGIAKGYAVDMAIEVLKRYSIRHALVNAGGDLRVIGGKSSAVPWKIAVRDPRNKNRIATTFEFYDGAVATSGDYQRPFKHIINPKSGRPAQGLLSATVVAETAMDADILAICLYVLGGERGAEFVQKRGRARAFVVVDHKARPEQESMSA